MTDKKQTMYELLGIQQSATLPEIKSAHRHLTRSLVSGESGLGKDEINHKLQVLDLALNTLSVQWSRDAYDAQLAAHNPSVHVDLPALNAMKVPQKSAFNSLQVAAALEETREMVNSRMNDPLAPLAIASSTVSSSVSALRKLLRLAGGVLALGAVIQVGLIISGSRMGQPYPEARAKAEEKVIIQDYYQKHGVRPASRAEAEALQKENQKQAQAQEKAELQKQQEQENYSRFVEESQRQSAQVSYDLQRAEESDRLEKERVRREAEWAQQRAEEDEREKDAQNAARARQAEWQERMKEQQQDQQQDQQQ